MISFYSLSNIAISVMTNVPNPDIRKLPSLPKNYVVPQNTPTTSVVEKITGYKDIIEKIWNCITNPIVIWHWFVDVSYWIFLIVAMIGIIYYIFTHSKKSINYTKISIASYIIVRVLNMCIS